MTKTEAKAFIAHILDLAGIRADIDLSLRGRALGQAHVKGVRRNPLTGFLDRSSASYTIRLNWQAIEAHNVSDDEVRDTIIHEVAHASAWNVSVGRKPRAHGKTWFREYRRLGGTKAHRDAIYHNVAEIKRARKKVMHEWRTETGATAFLGPRQHAKAERAKVAAEKLAQVGIARRTAVYRIPAGELVAPTGKTKVLR